MHNTERLTTKEGIEKLKELVEAINICLFCTNLKTDDGATCRPMSVQRIDADGNLWFFSEKNSEKNKEITEHTQVQLFFSHPPKSSFLVVNGEAEIILDANLTEELWTPLVKTWFQGGKDDPNISIIKVSPKTAYYWDAEGNRMINFFKMLASVVVGKNLVDAKEGEIVL